ncbi:hypothetical protein SYYSPA8_03040 [Streptomyces yaizuensis]|uniref:Secreted protein n=1 Tax=Streptomyces yaizuensis TaxID=2989713 RepID=A0ABQ5NS83_9ACTN|nr:hypothetical protein SYYSPA8_03040 [Streptomyces sp. YSPA8]
MAAAATAAAAVPAPTATAAAQPRTAMNGRRFRVNCFELLFVPYCTGRQSLCPRTRGPHHAVGWTFRPAYNLGPGGEGENASAQGNWRLCHRCGAAGYDFAVPVSAST